MITYLFDTNKLTLLHSFIISVFIMLVNITPSLQFLSILSIPINGEDIRDRIMLDFLVFFIIEIVVGAAILFVLNKYYEYLWSMYYPRFKIFVKVFITNKRNNKK